MYWSSDFVSSDLLGHMQVGVHARLQHGDAPQLVEFGGVGVVVEGAGDQHVEVRVRRLARRRHQVRPRHRAELGPDENPSAPFLLALCVSPRSEAHTSELQSLMRISYAVFCLKKK